MTDIELRFKAAAQEYQAVIFSLTERCTMLATANALANAKLVAAEAQIEKLTPPKPVKAPKIKAVA